MSALDHQNQFAKLLHVTRIDSEGLLNGPGIDKGRLLKAAHGL